MSAEPQSPDALTDMPRFYLHLCDDDDYHRDEEGIDLPNDAAARSAAIAGLRDILSGEIRRGQINIAAYINIESRAGERIDTVGFVDAVKIINQTVHEPIP